MEKQRRCLHCKVDISYRRRDLIYCNSSCRVMACRKRLAKKVEKGITEVTLTKQDGDTIRQIHIKNTQ